MAKPLPRRARRVLLVFLGSVAAHGLIFRAVATQVFRTETMASANETPVAPLTFAPRVPPSRRRLASLARSRALRIRLGPARAASSVAIAPVTTAQRGELAQLAPSLSLPSTNGDDAPPDLTGRTPRQPHYPINPGYWQVVEHWPLISRTERYCVEPWNIVRFMAAPCNHIYHCRYPVQKIEPDRFHFEGVITGRGDRFDVRGGGEYTATRLRVSISGLGHWHILPVIFGASLQGDFIGSDCPADAKRIQQRD